MLASLSDLRRYGASGTDADLQPMLEFAEQYVRRICARDWDATGDQTKTYWRRGQGDIITLPDEYPADVSLTGYVAPNDSGRALQPWEYSLTDHGQVLLVYAPFPPAFVPATFRRRDVGIADAVDSIDRPRPYRYDRILVSYTASGVVPAGVREGVAMIGAAWALQAPNDVSPVKSEKIGDYSYVMDGGLTIPVKALTSLQPYAAGGGPWPGEGRAATGQLIY